jgi:hypothetical protein
MRGARGANAKDGGESGRNHKQIAERPARDCDAAVERAGDSDSDWRLGTGDLNR